jgi:hypothetical protein
MKRNFGLSAREGHAGTIDPLSPRHAPGAAHSNSLTGIPPCRPNLAIVVSDRPFIPDRELQPIEPLDPRIDHREFAALVIFSVLLAVTFGAPLAVAVAFMSFG